MKYLITGGLGFIASNMIRYLFRKYPDCKILNVDKVSYCSNVDNLKGIAGKFDYSFSKTDIADPYIGQVIKEFNPDVVINAAAETHVDRSIRNPRAFLDADIVGVFNLILHSLKNDVKRFIHISTDEVYGPIEKGTCSEDAQLNPTSPYAASKAAGDLLLLSYVKTYGFPAIIVRPCNNYGRFQYPEKLIPMTITRMLQNEKIILHGKGAEIREYIYVDDCCRAIDLVEKGGNIGNIYNIGSGERINNLNVIKRVVHSMYGALDVESFLNRTPNRPGNDQRYAINSKKLTDELGDYLTTTFQNGAKFTTDWYINNKPWWDSLDVDLSANIYHNNREYLR